MQAAHPLLVPYALLHSLLSVASLVLASSPLSAYNISRSTLHLLSAMALLPIAFTSPSTRAPTLAALTTTVTLVVDSALRFLAALHQLSHPNTSLHTSPLSHTLSSLHLALSLVAIVLSSSRALPYLVNSSQSPIGYPASPPTSSSHPTHRARSTSRRKAKQMGLAKQTATADLSLLLVLLHSFNNALGRVVDLSAFLTSSSGSEVPALFDAFSALLVLRILFLPLGRLASVLLQETPIWLRAKVRGRIERILAVEGVVGVERATFWEETPGTYVGTISVVVSRDCGGGLSGDGGCNGFGRVVEAVNASFRGVVDEIVVQVVEEEDSGQGNLSVDASAGNVERLLP